MTIKFYKNNFIKKSLQLMIKNNSKMYICTRKFDFICLIKNQPMIKKLFLLSVIVSQLTISCSSDDNNETSSEQTLAEQIADIVKQPYSKLTPEQQKLKLEAEANEMLVQLDKSKNLSAIETIENLNRLLSINSVDIFNGKNDNEVEDILNVSGVYGIYTWNNVKKSWDKTASATELKFVFPAKETQTSNNASLTTKSTSSDIKVKMYDSYDLETGADVNDYFYLPNSADAVLTIDGKQVASFNQSAKYSNGKETPDEFSYKMTIIEGYSWEMSGKKAIENTSKANLIYNGKNLLSFNAGSTASIDALLNEDALTQYRGKANGLVQILDNFAIVADMDLAAAASDEAAFKKTLVYPTDYDSPTYTTDLNNYNKKLTEGKVANFNKNMKLMLVSKKDGTKIANIVLRSEKVKGDYYVDYYDEVYYLKFSDDTEAEMSVYFSKGFEKFEAKFEEFIKSFEN